VDEVLEQRVLNSYPIRVGGGKVLSIIKGTFRTPAQIFDERGIKGRLSLSKGMGVGTQPHGVNGRMPSTSLI